MSSKKRSADDSSSSKVKKPKSKTGEENTMVTEEQVSSGLDSHNFSKLSKKLRKSLLGTKFGENDELKELISQLTVVKSELEHDDGITKRDISIAVGAMILNRKSSLKTGSETTYTATVNDSDLLGRRRNAKMKHLLRIRYSFNEYLKSVYEGYQFVNLSDELFLEFVIHAITVVMDEVSDATA